MDPTIKKTPKELLYEEVKNDYDEWKMLVEQCPCGSAVVMITNHMNRTSHYKTKGHQSWLTTQGYDFKSTVYDHYLISKGRYFENEALSIRKVKKK